MTEKERFENWIKELRQLQVDHYKMPPNKPDSFYGDAESWKTYFDDNYSPIDALFDCYADAD